MPDRRVLVWDLPLRVFHWSLVICVTLLLLTGFGAAPLVWHLWLGELTLGLLVFRLVWGVLGGQSARFTDFAAGPAAAWRYLRSGQSPSAGHNPLGGWMVLALLLTLGLQTASGLLSAGDGEHQGPLARWAGATVAVGAAEWHATLALVLCGQVLLHLAAVVVHRCVFGHNLIRPMVDGYKRLPANAPVPRKASTRRAWMVVLLSAAVVGYLKR